MQKFLRLHQMVIMVKNVKKLTVLIVTLLPTSAAPVVVSAIGTRCSKQQGMLLAVHALFALICNTHRYALQNSLKSLPMLAGTRQVCEAACINTPLLVSSHTCGGSRC